MLYSWHSFLKRLCCLLVIPTPFTYCLYQPAPTSFILIFLSLDQPVNYCAGYWSFNIISARCISPCSPLQRVEDNAWELLKLCWPSDTSWHWLLGDPRCGKDQLFNECQSSELKFNCLQLFLWFVLCLPVINTSRYHISILRVYYCWRVSGYCIE